MVIQYKRLPPNELISGPHQAGRELADCLWNGCSASKHARDKHGKRKTEFMFGLFSL